VFDSFTVASLLHFMQQVCASKWVRNQY